MIFKRSKTVQIGMIAMVGLLAVAFNNNAFCQTMTSTCSHLVTILVTQNEAPVEPPPEMMQKRVQQHGTNATLRAKGHFENMPAVSLEKVTPNWQKPFPLTFRNLKQNYMFYKINKKFFEKGLPRVHGGAVSISGAVMPIDTPGKDGELSRFWIANPAVVMAGCVFCNPPTMADLVYVTVKGDPLRVDRERLYRSVLNMTVLGRFEIGPRRTKDGVEYLYSLELNKVLK